MASVSATNPGYSERPPGGPPLGGLAPETFLRRHWQKRARLVREAIPGFIGPFSRDDLFALDASGGLASLLEAN